MQFLFVYTGFIMQAVLGVSILIAGVLPQMFCPNCKEGCIKKHFQVFFEDPNMVCTKRNLTVNCSSQSDSNTTTCKGNGFQMLVDGVVKVECSSKQIHIACNTTLVSTSQPQETSIPSTTKSATTTVTSSSESTTTKGFLMQALLGVSIQTTRVLPQMFCPNCKEKCIKKNFQVFFEDPNMVCTKRNLTVNCSYQSDSNTTTCKGNGLQMLVDGVVKVECSTKQIHIACNTTLVSTSQPPETSIPSTTKSATTTVTSSSESSNTKAVSQASTASNTATLVGGVVGGILAGVVITVVVVVVWWKCRKRSEIQDDGKGESHIYHGLAPVGNSDHGAPTAVPDVIKVSQATRDTSPIPGFRSENQGETSGQDTYSQGDYTYIKEVELDEDGAYSLGKGFPNTVSFKDLAKSAIDSGSGQITDTYNRLGAHAVTSTPQTDTYNRIGGERKDGTIIKDSDEMHPSSDYFVLESSPDQEDTYNRLTAGDEPCGQHHNSTYNRIGETDEEHQEGMDQELTLPDYLILEKADIPGTQDDYNRLGYVSSETSSSNLKNTYNRIGEISSEEERSGPSPEYFILEKDDGQRK